MWTDALNRYRGYADEKICPPTAEPINWNHNLEKGKEKGHGKGAGMPAKDNKSSNPPF
jgi:hypothetical protein